MQPVERGSSRWLPNFQFLAVYEDETAPLPGVPSENLIRWIRRRKENRIMIETDGDLLQTSARIYAGLLSFA